MNAQPKKLLNPELILRKVSDICEISAFQMKQKVRDRDVVIPRQLSMYFMRMFTNKSLAEIGKLNGNKDHATVIHACRAIENAIETRDYRVIPQYNKILDALNKCKPLNERRKMKMPSPYRIGRIKSMILNRVPLEKRQEILIKQYA